MDAERRKIVRLTEDVRAVVEPVDPAKFEAAGGKSAVHMRVVELLVQKQLVEDE